MALNPQQLAQQIAQAIGQEAASPQTLGEATAIIQELMSNGLVSNLPGTVMGVAPPSGGPLSAGTATSGKILGISGPTLASAFQSAMGYPSITPQLLSLANGITGHILAAGMVSFTTGMILGACSNTATSPGALTGLPSTGGKIAGLDGSAMAVMISPPFGGPPSDQLTNMCKAICTHIMSQAVVTYSAGAIVGVVSAGGGPVAMGAGVGGKIT